MSTTASTFKETEKELERYRENEFIGADPRIVRQALVWVQTRDLAEVAKECGVSRGAVTRNMMSPLFMALVKHINEKIHQPDIIGPAWVQVQLLALNEEIRSGDIEPEEAKLRLSTLRAMQSTLPKRSEAQVEHTSAFGKDSSVTIDPSDYEEVEEDGEQRNTDRSGTGHELPPVSPPEEGLPAFFGDETGSGTP